MATQRIGEVVVVVVVGWGTWGVGVGEEKQYCSTCTL